MKACKDIENNLSLFLDGLLSEEDQADAEEHLQSCPRCTEALARLRKTKELANSLHDVEPPPWLRQKIMARVREEAGKKSFLYKLFYPLQIKIPVQIFATVCIAVLAAYIYRAGEDRMKDIVPSSAPAPVVQIQKSQLPEQKENPLVAKQTEAEGKVITKDDTSQEIVREKEGYQTKDFNEQTASNQQYDKQESAAPKAPGQSDTEFEQQKDRGVLGTAMKASVAPRAQRALMEPGIVLKVPDLDAAVREAEKILTQLEAKNITARILPGKAFLTADLSQRKLKDLSKQLSVIGLAEEKHIPTADTSGNITLVLEITNN